MENFRDEELDKMETDLHEKLEHPEGDSEEEQAESRKRSIETLTEVLSEIKCLKRMKSASSSMAGHSTTIIAEQATKIFCKDLTSANVTRWADQLKDHTVRFPGRHHSAEQLKMMLSEQDRIEFTQTVKSFRFTDGTSIYDAGNWLKWHDNEKLSDILKLVYPKSEAISDVQKILSVAFKIFWAKNPRHFFTFLAQLQQVLNWDDRQEELMALSRVAYNLLQDAILDQVIGKHAKSCEVTKEFIDSIKAKAPTKQHGSAFRHHCGGG